MLFLLILFQNKEYTNFSERNYKSRIGNVIYSAESNIDRNVSESYNIIYNIDATASFSLRNIVSEFCECLSPY